MLRVTPDGGFHATPLFTVGERIGDYQPPGVLDGTAAFRRPDGSVRVLVTHELDSDQGYPWQLANGSKLTGSRISFFDIDAATRRITRAGLAISRVFDRRGREVTAAEQVNERGSAGGDRGFEAFCSATGYARGESGFADDIFFAHEEVSAQEGHPHGGSVWALDVASGILWALPELGRGSWENSAAVTAPDSDRADGHTALLLGDDLETGRAPLYLWIGRRHPGGSFTERNGLADGRLHVWVADNGDRTPQQWWGTGSSRSGRFVPVAVREPERAGARGFDALGYLDDLTLRSRAKDLGAFMFSRPEDLHTNPGNGRQAVFASTGHGLHFRRDDWGGIYLIDLRFVPAGTNAYQAFARLTLLYDSDDTRDLGIRSPDNLAWARDGHIYVQEDKALKLGRFGAESGRETSIWQLDPKRPHQPVRIAEIERAAVPAGATDRKAKLMGEWESSGIIDVSALLGAPGETLLLANVQAHSVKDGPIGGASQLVEAGQMLLLSRLGKAEPATSGVTGRD
jgi:hypothetical protein